MTPRLAWRSHIPVGPLNDEVPHAHRCRAHCNPDQLGDRAERPAGDEQAARSPGPKREINLYDVRDLIKLRDSDNKLTAVDGQKLEGKNTQALASFVRAFMNPPLAKGDDVKTLGHGQLVVLARPNQQAWVQRCLNQNRKAHPYLLTVEATFVHMGDGTFNKHVKPLLPKDKKKNFTILDSTEKSRTFMNGLLKKKDVTLIKSPRYLAMPLQHTSMWMGREIKYVSNYKIKHIDQPKGVIADPVIETARDGILFEGTGALVDEDFIGLDFKLVIAEIHEPIHTETLQERQKDVPAKIKKMNLMVSLPDTTRTTLKTKVILPNKGWAVFSLGRIHSKHWILILKAERIVEPK